MSPTDACAVSLGEGNAGMLVFADGGDRPEYVPWANVQGVELDGFVGHPPSPP